MKKEETTITSSAAFSDDKTKRYKLSKIWYEGKSAMAVIMLAPSDASGVMADTSTMLVMNNAYRLGYGRVTILNLFAEINAFDLKNVEEYDDENLKAIVSAVKNVDTIVYAAGVGKAKNKVFQKRQNQVLNALAPYADKLYCLCDQNGEARLQHPLSPAVRKWHLSPLGLDEFELTAEESTEDTPKKGKGKEK